MRVATAAFALLAACGPATPDATTPGGGLADADGSGGGGEAAARVRKEVAAAIAAETTALAALDADIVRAEQALDGGGEAAIDALVTLRADRIARRSFLLHLRRCTDELQPCPPKLDEPRLPASWDASSQSLTGAFTAELARWPVAAADLAAAACACRTRSCAEWTLVDLGRWESALSLADQDDEAAAASVTMARSCAYARLGSGPAQP